MNDGCPTCGHTLAQLTVSITGVTFWHCERCGTIVSSNRFDIYVPKLVERCRLLLPALTGFESPLGAVQAADIEVEWRRLGIRESINRPEDRP